MGMSFFTGVSPEVEEGEASDAPGFRTAPDVDGTPSKAVVKSEHTIKDETDRRIAFMP
jgi:hypothetical protein